MPVGKQCPILRRLAVAIVVAVLAVAASATTATASTSASRWATVVEGWDRRAITVADGRSWAVFQRGSEIELRAQHLAGGATRAWRAALPRSLDGVPGYAPTTGGYVDGGLYRSPLVDRVVVDGGRVAVEYSWCLSGEDLQETGFERCVGNAVASFRANDGADPAVVSAPGEHIAGSDPLTLVQPADLPLTAGHLRILRTGAMLPLPAGVSRPSPQLPASEGDRILQFWFANSGARSSFTDLAVADVRTGATAYALRYDDLWARISRTKPAVSLAPHLVHGGELAVAYSSPRRGAQPVLVDAAGRVRKVGSRLGGATQVRVEPAGPGRRVMVYVSGYTKRSTARRSCQGLWVVDRAGRRGARLRLPRGFTIAGDDAPASWDGRTLVYGRVVSQPSGDRDRAVLVWRGLDTLRLRSSTVPRCAKGRR